ncbi:MAG: hypothetical protein ABIS86_05080 [Streptosporangiaceae bacterium]
MIRQTNRKGGLTMSNGIQGTVARFIAAAAAGAAILLFASGGVAAAAPAIGSAHEVATRAGASCIVTGYSLHADQEMAADGISSDYVEQVVYQQCRSAKKQGNGTWKYTTKYITVIANSNGYIITVWRN